MAFTKTLIAACVGALCFGCVHNRVPTPTIFVHPSYGEVELPDERYAESQLSCKQSVYQKGVLVNGSQTVDMETIDATIAEAFSWYVRQVQAMRSSKRAAAIGHSTGMAVSGIHIPVMLPADYGLENPELPQKYHDVLRAHGDVGRCMLDKGWSRKKE